MMILNFPQGKLYWNKKSERDFLSHWRQRHFSRSSNEIGKKQEEDTKSSYNLSGMEQYLWPKSSLLLIWGFPNGSEVKNPPVMQELQESQVQFLGLEDPLEEDMASFLGLPGESHGQRLGGLQSIGSERVGPNWSDLAYTPAGLSVLRQNFSLQRVLAQLPYTSETVICKGNRKVKKKNSEDLGSNYNSTEFPALLYGQVTMSLPSTLK